MCGIAGYIQRESAELPPIERDDQIERMIASIAHRGPDGQGFYRASRGGWRIALGHCRLAIIDPRGGHQPMANEDESLQIVFNGEVYRHAALRNELISRGHRLHTTSDTEAMLHYLEEHPKNPAPAMASFDGMFALGLWDHRRGTLLIARDRAGIKPLYYASLPDGGIVFGSELKVILAHPQLRSAASVDPNALASFLFMDYAMSPGTILKGVRKLEPGSFMSWEDGTITQPRLFWRIGMRHAPLEPTHAGQVAQVRSRVEEGVIASLVADVPVGMFLSGGLDSSLVAAIAVKHAATPFHTFSVRMDDDPEFDQSNYARIMAAHIGSTHIEEPVSPQAMLGDLDAALDSLDEPMADPSILPTFALSRLAARHVKVVLSGDGADELWGGYPTCRAHEMARWYKMIPGFFRRGVIEPFVRQLAVGHGYQSFDWKAKRFALRWDDADLTRHLRWMSSIDLPELVNAGAASARMPREFANAIDVHPTGDPINDILRLDFSTYMSGAVLTKVDRASMAHGLEVRPPLLSNDLIDLAYSMPSSVKARGKKNKMILREAVRDLLPSDVLDRPKMGFAIPLARWLRGKGPLRERTRAALEQGKVWEFTGLNRETYQRWDAEHDQMKADRSRPLWGLIVLDHWVRRTLGRS
jgi:asparagine synthase (glutamine-hydrolysing)